MPQHHQDKGHKHGHGHQHGIMTGWVVPLYDWFVSGVLMRGTYRRIAAGLTAGVRDGERVLDIGTGPGRLVAEIARRRPGLEVVGIDPSPDMLRRARSRTSRLANARAVLASAEDLPFEDESVDAVVSSLSSHHWADSADALAEQARVLRPGGRLWVLDLASHLDDDLSAEVTAAGLRLTDEDAAPRGVVGRRLVLISARKPLAAA
ncbi:MAG TPA: class I SAM-dependent methyltransferase [Microlunatus sp.]|nr:class I SAM-dependent methyltransferase [Microlunatus sp.]